MPRIDDTLRASCARGGRTGLVTYVTAGDPDLDAIGRDHASRLDRAGADVIEVGVPFSDPLADGPVIQRATERALAAGATLRERARPGGRPPRRRSRAPIVLFSYANPILRMGLDALRDAGAARPASTAC